MIGKNRIILNLATMQAAVEHYFNQTQLNAKSKIKVTAVKEITDGSCPCFSVEAESGEKEED